tara:strand:+ start:101 stop:541 length:441 start_codon:yes stop_codon:yes gene_type:complete
LGLCIGLNKGKSLDGRLCKEYKYRSMKKLLSLVTIVLLMSCESKEEVEKQIASLKVEVVDLKNNDAIINYTTALSNLNKQELNLETLSKQLEQSTEDLQTISRDSLLGALSSINEAAQRIENLKPAYEDIMNEIKVKEEKIKALGK